MKKIFLVLTLLVSSYSNSFMGVGMMKCSKILADLDGGPPMDEELKYIIINWSQGFIAGLNFYGMQEVGSSILPSSTK